MTTAHRSHQVRCVRSAVTLSAEVHGAAETAVPDFFTEIVNMSGSGCLMATDRPMRVGQVIMMRFSLPGLTEVETSGLVARVDGREEDALVGVSFQALEERDSDMIVRHVVREDRRRQHRAAIGSLHRPMRASHGHTWATYHLNVIS